LISKEYTQTSSEFESDSLKDDSFFSVGGGSEIATTAAAAAVG